MNFRSMAGIFVPALIAILLYFISMFVFFIPSIRNNLLEEKKRHVKELTETSWGILYAYFIDELSGILPSDTARKLAIEKIARIRYGTDKKDYFWIIDTVPVMVMHPYRTELIGKNVSDFKDIEGKKLFLEAVELTSRKGEGYLRYMWQWKDDSLKIADKISFVKLFRPWGWIIGTGIYIDDIKAETHKLTIRTIEISAGIFFLILIVMGFLVRHAFKLELLRKKAERERKLTFEKYKALAEANPEGVIMVFEDYHINLNKNMQRILGYSDEDIPKLHIHDLFSQQQLDMYLGEKYFRYLMLGVAEPKQFEARIRRKDGTFLNMFVNCSRIMVSDHYAAVLSVKDVQFTEFAEKQMGIIREKYKDLLNMVQLGFFRFKDIDNSIFIEVNKAFSEILGYTQESDLYSLSFKDLFFHNNEWDLFAHYMNISGFVKNFQAKLKGANGKLVNVELTSLHVIDYENETDFFEGLIIDRSGVENKLREKENLLLSMSASSFLLYQPLKHISKKVIWCEEYTTISELIEVMQKNNTDAILIRSGNNLSGIITDHDLRNRVLKKGLGNDITASEILTQSLITLPETALAYEALMKMQELKINHLPVIGDNQLVTGMISVNDILELQLNTLSGLIFSIQQSSSVNEWTEIRMRIYTLCKVYIQAGANFRTITDLITNISDVIVVKLCEFAEKEFGPPPVSYSFIALGSQGRRELTLKTDQDNALIFDNVPPDNLEDVRKYFLKFGEYICFGLDKAGFELCPGELMALNPKWCLSLNEWKSRYSKWILSDTKDEIFEYTAFFDLRSVAGDPDLFHELNNHISGELQKSKIVLKKMYSNLCKYKSPVNIFGKIITEKTDRHLAALNLKKSIAHITDLVRVLSHYYHFEEVSTCERLHHLTQINNLDKNLIAELQFSFKELMMTRIKNQIDALDKGKIVDNYFDIRYLSEIEYDNLKRILMQVARAHKKFSFTW